MRIGRLLEEARCGALGSCHQAVYVVALLRWDHMNSMHGKEERLGALDVKDMNLQESGVTVQDLADDLQVMNAIVRFGSVHSRAPKVRKG